MKKGGGHNLKGMFLSKKSCRNVVLKVKIQNGLRIGKNSVDQMGLFKLFIFTKQRKHHHQTTVCSESFSIPILCQFSLCAAAQPSHQRGKHQYDFRGIKAQERWRTART